MKQSRRKIIVGVMIPVIIALIVLKVTMGRPWMVGLPMIAIDSLLLTGALIGVALSQVISAVSRPPRKSDAHAAVSSVSAPSPSAQAS